ncbi:hypothetical protein ACW17M_02860 [Vreelandella sp. 2A-K22]
MTSLIARPTLVLGTALLLTGCMPESFAKQEIDQSNICVASSDEQAMQCPEGELFLARLITPSPQQRPFSVLNTAALYCDTNHQITQNAAGVLCVMTHERFDVLTQDTSTEPMEGNPEGGAASDNVESAQE